MGPELPSHYLSPLSSPSLLPRRDGNTAETPCNSGCHCPNYTSWSPRHHRAPCAACCLHNGPFFLKTLSPFHSSLLKAKISHTMSLNDSTAQRFPGPSPFPLSFSFLSLPPFFFHLIIIIVIITLELRELYLGHFNQLYSDLIKGKSGLCEKEAAGRGGRHTSPQGPVRAHTGPHVHTPHRAHATRQALTPDKKGIRDKHNFLLMPMNKGQDQILWERPRNPSTPKPHN